MSDQSLRERLVTQLARSGVLHSRAVAEAMRAVPRHRFMPGIALDDAYADRAIAIKVRDDEVLSSISQPGMVVQMLELLAPQNGQHVLEIGTGSGYNAALLAEIVGPLGSVTTIELDPELADRARQTLEELGYGTVRVVAGDGTHAGTPASYDCVIVTARSEDVAAAWWQATIEGSRLVVPLRLEGAGEYAVGFVRYDRRLQSIGALPCAFIAIRGEAADGAKGDVFYRDPAARERTACVRRVKDVLAVARADATIELLTEFDMVIARPVTLFAVRFA